MAKNKRLPVDTLYENIDVVKELSEQLGYTASEIGEEFGVNKSCVLRFLIKTGIKKYQWGGQRGVTIPLIEIQRAMFFRERFGWSCSEIGVAMGLNRGAVAHRLRLGGIDNLRRDLASRTRKAPPPTGLLVIRSEDDITVRRQKAYQKRYHNNESRANSCS